MRNMGMGRWASVVVRVVVGCRPRRGRSRHILKHFQASCVVFFSLCPPALLLAKSHYVQQYRTKVPLPVSRIRKAFRSAFFFSSNWRSHLSRTFHPHYVHSISDKRGSSSSFLSPNGSSTQNRTGQKCFWVRSTFGVTSPRWCWVACLSLVPGV